MRRPGAITISVLTVLVTLGLVLGNVPLIGRTAMADVLVNNPLTDTTQDTQSEVSLVVFGSTIVAGFNDSGSFVGGANKFTGYARSIDGGLNFVDLGTLPTNTIGDSGDPVLVRDNSTGTVYFSTLPFNPLTSGVQVFRSFDGGLTFTAPVGGTPGRTSPDVPKITVDNFAGPGQGNVYVASRTFDAGNGIYFFRSTDGGATFGPSGGSLIASAAGGNVHGAWVTVGPDHSVYVFWFDQASSSIRLRKSTDGGVTFGAPVTAAAGIATTGVNGDLGLTGIRSGTSTPAGFRSVAFPQAVVNPVTGQIYLVFPDNPAGIDKADIFLVVSSDGGATWSARVRVNSDATVNDQWQPTLAVTLDGSRLGIFWYDRRLDSLANNFIDYFGDICTLSGGVVTCGLDFRVSDVSFPPEFGRDPVVNVAYMGDYDIAQADNAFFYVAWGDNRDLNLASTRNQANVYFDRIPTGLQATVSAPASLLLFGVSLAGLGAFRLRCRPR